MLKLRDLQHSSRLFQPVVLALITVIVILLGSAILVEHVTPKTNTTKINYKNNIFINSKTSVLGANTVITPKPGLVLIWGDANEVSTLQSKAWLNDGQIVFDWGTAEPSQGSFPEWTGPGNSLNTQLAAYQAMDKTTTVQINADTFPSWVVNTNNSNSLIDYCGYRSLSASGQGSTATVPAYWYKAGSDGLNPAYESAMSTMLTSLAQAIASSPYKSAVLGIRTGFDLIGTEHYQVTDDSSVHLASPLPAECQGWTPTLGDEAAGKVLYLNYQVFNGAGVHTLLRTEAANISSGPGKYFAQDGGFSSTSDYLSPSKAWLFVTNADPDQGQNNLSNYVPLVKSGQTVGYAEQYNDASLHNDPLSWEWWRELMDLSRGTTYVATYYNDITNSTLANNFFNDSFFQNFVNTYAGNNNTSAESQSPGAWIAFAPSSSPFGGNLGLFMNQTAATNVTGYDSNLGLNILDPGQPYGRYASKVNPGGSLTVAPDSGFPSSGSAILKIWYYNPAKGSWSINGGSVNQTVQENGSSSWQTATFSSSTIPSSIILSVPRSSASGTDFHMVEITRGGGTASCSGNPTINFTAPSNNATISGNNISLSVNTAPAANCGLSSVVFKVDSSPLVTVTTYPYSTTWNSTTNANGAHTLSATVTDSSGHSTTTSINIMVANNNPGGNGGSRPQPGSSGSSITIVGNSGTLPILAGTTDKVKGEVTLAPSVTPILLAANGSTMINDPVVRVVYHLNSRLIDTDTKSPFQYHLNTTNYLNGTYDLTTVVYYQSGKVSTMVQKLIIANPFSLKQLGLMTINYSLPIGLAFVVLLIGTFTFYWIQFKAPSGRVAIVFRIIVGRVRGFFHHLPPINPAPPTNNDLPPSPPTNQLPGQVFHPE
jgi:hypothetical protein